MKEKPHDHFYRYRGKKIFKFQHPLMIKKKRQIKKEYRKVFSQSDEEYLKKHT